MRSESSSETSALPRRVVMRTRPPSATPIRAASSGFMRSAPDLSFRRQSGLRMMVLAVNERRSPADSTKGNSALEPGASSSASEASSGKSSGIASWMRLFEVWTRAKLSSQSSTLKTTALGPASSASKSASAASPGSPVKPARASDFGWRCAAI